MRRGKVTGLQAQNPRRALNAQRRRQTNDLQDQHLSCVSDSRRHECRSYFPRTFGLLGSNPEPMTRTEICGRVKCVLAKCLDGEEKCLELDTRLGEDLKMDSLDIIEFCLALRREFRVPVEPEDIQPRTLMAVVKCLDRRLDACRQARSRGFLDDDEFLDIR